MAGQQKEFELLFKLKASLGGDFKKTFKQAVDAQKQLKDSMKSVSSVQSKIGGYTKVSNAIEQQKRKLEDLRAGHEKILPKIQEHQANVERLRAKIEETGDTTGELTAQLVKEESEVAKNTERLESNERQMRQTTARIKEQEERLGKLGEELRDAGVDTDNLEGANTRLKKSFDKLKSSQETLKELNARQQEVKDSIGQTKSQLKGTVGVMGAIAAAVYAGPVKSAQEYESALAKVSTIADGTKVPMGTMAKQIMTLSNETGIAATLLADDVYNAISAGQDTADAVGFVVQSTKLAKAGFAESAQTLDVLTTILNAYGMESSETGKVSDMLIQTQNKGKVTVAELSSVMGKIIPTAKSNGVALEQVTAGYAVMTAKGIAAAETTTYMNSMMNELGKSGTAADKSLRAAAGKGFKELMQEGKSLSEVLGILQDDAAKGGKSLADVFGSAEAGKAALTLLSDGVEGFNAQVENMRAASEGIGATQTAFELMEQASEEKMAKAKNSIKNLMTVFGQMFLPMIGDLAESVTPVITKISEFAQENPKLVQTITKVAAGLGAARLGFLGLKVAGLTGESGIISLGKKLVGLRAGMLENAATSATFGEKLSGAGKGMLSYFGKAGKALGGVGSKIGKDAVGKIASGPLGKIGGVIMGGISKPLKGAGRLFTPIANAAKSILGPVGKVAQAALGPLGGIAGKVFPIVGVITAVITAFKLVKDHLQEIRGFIKKTFGEEALAVFDKAVGVVGSVGEAIKNIFSDGNIDAAGGKIQEIFGDKGLEVFKKLVGVAKGAAGVGKQVVDFIFTNIVPVAEKVLDVIVRQVVPGIIQFMQDAAPIVMQIVQSIADFVAAAMPIIADAIAAVMPIISDIIDIITAYVFPIISDIFSFVTTTVLPVISRMVQALLPVIANVMQMLVPLIKNAVTTIWNVVNPIIQAILQAVQVVMPIIQGIVEAGVNYIGGIIDGLAKILDGIITFITGVFTGNWRQAWEGVKKIFSGIFDTMKGIVKGTMNGIIDVINGGIKGLNKIKLPGREGANIPTIPKFAKGTRNTPDTFIAGEEGPELITGQPGKAVFTAEETRNIIASQRAAQVAGAMPTAGVPSGGKIAPAAAGAKIAPAVSEGKGAGGGSKTIIINNSPTIIVDGEDPGDLEDKLKKNNQELLQKVDEKLSSDDDGRTRFE